MQNIFVELPSMGVFAGCVMWSYKSTIQQFHPSPSLHIIKSIANHCTSSDETFHHDSNIILNFSFRSISAMIHINGTRRVHKLHRLNAHDEVLIA